MKKYVGVRHLGKNYYEINFRLYKKAERIFKRIEAFSMQEAFVKRAEMVAGYMAGKKTADENRPVLVFSSLETELDNDLRADQLVVRGISRYMCTFRLFFYRFLPAKYPGIESLNGLNAAVFNDYKKYFVNELKRTGWRSELICLKAIIHRFVLNGFCEKRVSEDIALLKRPKTTQKTYVIITKTEKRALLDYVKKDNLYRYGVLYFLMRLGWRIEETLAVKKDNIKWKGLEPISIKLDAQDRKNKRNFELTAIDEDLANVIRQYAFRDKDSPWLFPNSAGSRQKSDRFRTYLARVSRDVIRKRLTPHDFRHSFITEAALSNMPIRDVMAITGHLDIDVILKYYSHSTPEGQSKVMAMSRV